MHKFLFGSVLFISASVAVAKPLIALDPFGSGLEFSEPTRSMPAEHPLYHRVSIEPLIGMTGHVGTPFTRFVGDKELYESLQQSLSDANMVAEPAAAKARLTVTWLGLDAPMTIGIGSHAKVRMRYDLRRVDNGQTIFSREIETQAASRGGDATVRLRSTARAAIATNIASAIHCLDKAATVGAPENCSLQVGGQFPNPITQVVTTYRRR